MLEFFLFCAGVTLLTVSASIGILLYQIISELCE